MLATITIAAKNTNNDNNDIPCSKSSVQHRNAWLTLTATVPCSNAAETRNPLKCGRVPQTRQEMSAASGAKFTAS